MRIGLFVPTLALVAAAPLALCAATFATSITTSTEFNEGGLTLGPVLDFATGPVPGAPFAAESLVLTTGRTFPGFPNAASGNLGFASAAGDSDGRFGVGVNSLHLFPDPIARTEAEGSSLVAVENDGDEAISIAASFFIPAPLIVMTNDSGILPPPDPFLDIKAVVQASVDATFRRAGGTTEEAEVLDYGIVATRNPGTGLIEFTAFPGNAGLTVDRGPRPLRAGLPALTVADRPIGTLAPGDTLILDLTYSAFGQTGFNETGVFAAIGDPFDLAGGGGRASLALVDAAGPPPPAAVPLPAALPLLGLGLAALAGAGALRGRAVGPACAAGVAAAGPRGPSFGAGNGPPDRFLHAPHPTSVRPRRSCRRFA